MPIAWRKKEVFYGRDPIGQCLTNRNADKLRCKSPWKDNRDIASASFLLRISKLYQPDNRSECTLRIFLMESMTGSGLISSTVYGPVVCPMKKVLG